MKASAKTLLERARKLRRKATKAARAHTRTVVSDGLVLAGGAVACHALFLIWAPAGFLAIAAVLAGAGVMAANPAKKKRPAGDDS